jgi:hypothetical protein
MKKLIYFFLLVTTGTYAQTGIGTTSPHQSAKLEVNASDKGFLPPRVALTATNSASPISNPANGLMVFNTASAGASPFNVVPGYYYWDGVGLRWVSISTTVGNVQNQAIYRSSSSTATGNAISSWLSSFNNLAAGDFTMTSTTSFTLSNGFYKLEWALPYQSGGTYNDMLLQEMVSSTWGTFRNNDAYARIANGGSGNWGGGTFAADVVDCSTSSRTFRLYNADGANRAIFAGATLIITKLNPSITTSTTADNLGNHIANSNIQLNGNYLSNDGGNEGIRVDNSGNVGINNASPTQALDVTGSGRFSTSLINSGTRTYFGKDGSNMHWFGTTDAIAETNNLGYGFESNGSSIQSHRWNIGGSERMRISSGGNLGIGVLPTRRLHVLGSDNTTVYVESTTSDNNGLMILNANTNQNWSAGWHEFIMFQNSSNVIGQITSPNGSSVSYNTTSDYRLKQDLKPYKGLELINCLKTYDFAWKIDNSRMYGFMAHELQEVLPYLVSGQKDAVDANGKIIPQTVDYSKLTPILVKAIQEQDETINNLKKDKERLEKMLKDIQERLLKLENKGNEE